MRRGLVAGLRHVCWVDRRHRYLPLDTLRAVAITLVFLAHSGGMPLGWSGVDLFFILSGYLITGGLIRAPRQKGYFRHFYMRRALRIMPAFYLVIVLALILVPTTSGWYAPWAAVYLGNVANALWGFDTALGHLWSLAVEEQFYLLWPLAIWFCATVRSRWVLVGIVIAVAPVARLLFAETIGWEAAHTLLPARMDQLAVGAGLALLETSVGFSILAAQRWLLLAATAMAGLVFGGVAFTLEWSTTPYMVISLEASLLFYGLLVTTVLAWRGTIVERVLSWGPAVYIGQISYGIYLFHLPAAFWAEANGEHIRFVTALITLPMAMMSWHLFEKPINGLKRGDTRRQGQAASELGGTGEAELVQSGSVSP
jgi:peptidoglycan/LPS O-acetylase OafA/YrhL